MYLWITIKKKYIYVYIKMEFYDKLVHIEIFFEFIMSVRQKILKPHLELQLSWLDSWNLQEIWKCIYIQGGW